MFYIIRTAYGACNQRTSASDCADDGGYAVLKGTDEVLDSWLLCSVVQSLGVE